MAGFIRKHILLGARKVGTPRLRLVFPFDLGYGLTYNRWTARVGVMFSMRSSGIDQGG